MARDPVNAPTMPTTPTCEVSPISTPTILISCLHYDWETLESACERCRDEFGLDGIEFSFPHPRIGEAELPRLRELTRRFGLHSSVHVWDNLAALGVAAGVERLHECLRICREARFTHAVLHGGSHPDQARGLEITREALQAAAPAYEQANVVLCLENHYAYDYHASCELGSTAGELAGILGAVDSPAVRFCLDYGHSQMVGNTRELLVALAPFLAYTHLADNMGRDDDHLAFGRGVVPWRQVFEWTREVGYPGPFTVEFPVREGVYEALGECVAMLREVFA